MGDHILFIVYCYRFLYFQIPLEMLQCSSQTKKHALLKLFLYGGVHTKAEKDLVTIKDSCNIFKIVLPYQISFC